MTFLTTVARSYGLFIVKALAALAVIAAAAWALVRFGGQRLGRRKDAKMQVLERLPLDTRRSLFIVEVDNKRLLIGTSEGSVRLVERLDPTPASNEPPETTGDNTQ